MGVLPDWFETALVELPAVAQNLLRHFDGRLTSGRATGLCRGYHRSGEFWHW
jgi:hypothetical protein